MKRPTRIDGPAGLTATALGLQPTTLSFLESLDGFTVLERRDLGAQGEIYLASVPDSGERVALKVLHPRDLDDPRARSVLQREADLLARIDHPNVVRHVASGTATGTRGEVDYLATEWVDGQSLSRRIGQGGALPAHCFLPLARQATHALAAVHRAGLIHRDIKANNFLLTPEGRLVLIDFGLARDPRRHPPKPRAKGWTRSAPLAYQPPELLQGGTPDARCDVYSLGVVLYRMATRQRPFSARQEGDLCQAIANDPPRAPRAWVPELDPAVEAMILRCLEKEPKKRFSSGMELAEAFETPAYE